MVKEEGIGVKQKIDPGRTTSDYFDKYVGSYKSLLDSCIGLSGEKSEYFDHYKVDFLKRWIPMRDQEVDILDFGCGMGGISSLIAQAYPRSKVHGYDPSRKSIDFAREKWNAIENVEFKSGLLGTNYYDLIVIANVFHHIKPEERREMLILLKSFLKPDGNIVIFEHNPINPLTSYVMKTCPLDINARPIHLFQFVKLGRSCGLNVYLKRYIVFFPRALSFLRRFEPLMGYVPLGAQYSLILG
jgi:2-polyprenyl-3-methyl-5-hydroxy-6-metoxy-1,4-benzoquinol methylase